MVFAAPQPQNRKFIRPALRVNQHARGGGNVRTTASMERPECRRKVHARELPWRNRTRRRVCDGDRARTRAESGDQADSSWGGGCRAAIVLLEMGVEVGPREFAENPRLWKVRVGWRRIFIRGYRISGRRPWGHSAG